MIQLRNNKSIHRYRRAERRSRNSINCPHFVSGIRARNTRRHRPFFSPYCRLFFRAFVGFSSRVPSTCAKISFLPLSPQNTILRTGKRLFRSYHGEKISYATRLKNSDLNSNFYSFSLRRLLFSLVAQSLVLFHSIFVKFFRFFKIFQRYRPGKSIRF